MAALKESFIRRPSSIYSVQSYVSTTASVDSSHVSQAVKQIHLHERKDPIGGSWLELFYDLFFAASLSTFSRIHDISSKRDLANLAAFFTILWWTWTSQTLYDVRFSRYLKSEKAAKFVALSNMIGYGVFEGDFSLFTVQEGREPHTMAHQRMNGPRISAIAISLLFIFCRLHLAFGYYVISKRSMNNTRLLRIKSILPLIGASFWVISLFFIDQQIDGFFAIRTSLWIAGILFEVIATFLVRYQSQGGFEKTRLTERFGSLTIILLGEGVIKLVAVLRDVHSGVGFNWKSAIGILAAVFAFYLLFAIYFEKFDINHRLGKLSAYSWAYLHCFFHLSLILILDGITSMLLFTNISSGISRLLDASTESEVMQQLFSLHSNASLSTPLTVDNFGFTYNRINATMTNNGTELSASEYGYVYIQVFSKMLRSYGVEPSEEFVGYVHKLIPMEVTQHDVKEAFSLLLHEFTTTAQFFLFAGGIVLWSSIPLLIIQGRLQGTSWARFGPVLIRAVVGSVLLSIAGLSSAGLGGVSSILESGFMVPGFLLAVGVVYACDRVVSLIIDK